MSRSNGQQLCHVTCVTLTRLTKKCCILYFTPTCIIAGLTNRIDNNLKKLRLRLFSSQWLSIHNNQGRTINSLHVKPNSNALARNMSGSASTFRFYMHIIMMVIGWMEIFVFSQRNPWQTQSSACMNQNKSKICLGWKSDHISENQAGIWPLVARRLTQSVWVSPHSHTIPISTGFPLCVIAVPPCTVHHKNLITSSNMGDLQGIIVIRRHADFFQCLRTHVTIIEKGTTPISKTKYFKLYRFCQTDSLWINGYLRC